MLMVLVVVMVLLGVVVVIKDSGEIYFLINGVGEQTLRFGGVSAQTQP